MAFKRPAAEKKLSILTIIFIDSCVNDICLTIIYDIADTKALPVAKKSYQVLSDFPSRDLETKDLVSRFDVQETREPIRLRFRRACRGAGRFFSEIESGEDGRRTEIRCCNDH